MIVTTTPGIEGRNVSDYLGVVVAQGVLVSTSQGRGRRDAQHLRRSLKSYENELVGGSDSLIELEKQAQQLMPTPR